MSEPVFEGRDLVKFFPAGSSRLFRRSDSQVKAVDGVSFAVHKGKTLGIVGESGCGKSTLARVMTRLLDPTAGALYLDGQDVTRASGRELLGFRRRVQMIFQDPYSSLNPRHSVGQIISTPLEVQGLESKDGAKRRVQEMMELVGLNPEHFNRYPHEFSGGQRQRIGIARALVLKPDVLVADEPVSALDVSIQAQILNLLQSLQGELGLSYVFIAHDLSVMRHFADEVSVMYLGKVVEAGSVDPIFSNTAHPYSTALLSAVPVPVPRRKGETRSRIRLVGDVPSPVDPPSGCRFRTRCWKAADLCAEAEPALEAHGPGRSVACHFPMVPA